MKKKYLLGLVLTNLLIAGCSKKASNENNNDSNNNSINENVETKTETNTGTSPSTIDTKEKTYAVQINGEHFPMQETDFYDGYQKTYVYGYHYLNVNDTVRVIDEKTSFIYGYRVLDDICEDNKRDFEKGTNDNIIIKTSGKYSFEFKRNGKNELTVKKVFESAAEGDFDIVMENTGDAFPLTLTTYAKDSKFYKDETWLINNDKISNVDDVKNAIKNGLTVYKRTMALEKNQKFRIANFTDMNNVKYLPVDHVLQGCLSSEGDYFKINKTSTYVITYIPAFDALYVVGKPDFAEIWAFCHTPETITGTKLTPESNKCTYTTPDVVKDDYVYFYCDTATGKYYFDFQLDTGVTQDNVKIIQSADETKIVFLRSGKYKMMLDVSTSKLNVVIATSTHL